MSGFEIAGIVLASFSILADAGKDSKGLIGKTKDWWTFGLAFEDFMLRLDTERVAFLQNLDSLVSSTSIPDEQREHLMKDLGSQFWDDPIVKEELKRRITPRYYDWYLAVLIDINEALQETMCLLPIGEVQRLDARGTENVLFRLKTSFSTRKEKLLNRIQDRNDEISKFLARESMHPEHVAHSRHSSGTSKECSVLVQCQRKSQRLYESVLPIWKCECSSNHQWSIGAAHYDQKDRKTNIHLLLQNATSLSVILARYHSRELISATAQKEEQTRTVVLQDIADLRNQVVAKNNSRISPSIKGKGILGKILGKSGSKRQVRFSVSTPNDASPGPTQPMPLIDPIPDICGSIRSVAASGEAISLGHIETTTTATTGDAWELLLLQTATSPDTTHCDPLATFLTKVPARKERIEIGLGIALNLLSLSQTWIPPDLDKTFVKIIEQPSTPDNHGVTTFISHPHLFPPSEVVSPASPVGSAERTRRSLLALGILLLELLFGQTLEAQPCRSQFLGPGGEPNAYTDMCTAMEWQKRVQLEVGDGLSQAIQRCVSCDFGTERDLNNPKFLQAVLDLVVTPIREFLSLWGSQAASGVGWGS